MVRNMITDGWRSVHVNECSFSQCLLNTRVCIIHFSLALSLALSNLIGKWGG
jgi:hypothetical protein